MYPNMLFHADLQCVHSRKQVYVDYWMFSLQAEMILLSRVEEWNEYGAHFVVFIGIVK